MSRSFRPPAAQPKNKSSFSTPITDVVHLQLKSLRTASQQLAPSKSQFEDEVKLLERLYYKYKNSHRPTTPWRKIEETRRICCRISECDPVALVVASRTPFYEPSMDDSSVRVCNLRLITNMKLQRKRKMKFWSAIPNSAFIDAFITRMDLVCELLTKVNSPNISISVVESDLGSIGVTDISQGVPVSMKPYRFSMPLVIRFNQGFFLLHRQHRVPLFHHRDSCGLVTLETHIHGAERCSSSRPPRLARHPPGTRRG